MTTCSTTYALCDSWQCVSDWFMGGGATNAFTLLGAIATVWVSLLALRFSLRETRTQKASAVLRAKIAVALYQPMVREVWLYAMQLAQAVQGVQHGGNKKIEMGEEALARFRELVSKAPALLTAEQIAEVAPLGNKLHADLAIAMGRLQHALRSESTLESYLDRWRMDQLAPHEWSFDQVRDDLETAKDRLQGADSKCRYLVYNMPASGWDQTTDVPVLHYTADRSLRAWLNRQRWFVRPKMIWLERRRIERQRKAAAAQRR